MDLSPPTAQYNSPHSPPAFGILSHESQPSPEFDLRGRRHRRALALLPAIRLYPLSDDDIGHIQLGKVHPKSFQVSVLSQTLRNLEEPDLDKRHLTPGGYFEIQEIDILPECDDGTLKPDSAMVRCAKLLGEAATIFGRSFPDVQGLVHVMRDVGFVDVKIKKLKWPINTWPKDDHHKLLGAWEHENIMSGVEGWTMAPFTRALGWKKEEVEVFLIDVRRECRDRSIHAYWPW